MKGPSEESNDRLRDIENEIRRKIVPAGYPLLLVEIRFDKPEGVDGEPTIKRFPIIAWELVNGKTDHLVPVAVGGPALNDLDQDLEIKDCYFIELPNGAGYQQVGIGIQPQLATLEECATISREGIIRFFEC